MIIDSRNSAAVSVRPAVIGGLSTTEGTCAPSHQLTTAQGFTRTMQIHFQCYNCGNQFHVTDSMAGTRARCQQCGAIVTVPVMGSPLQPAEPAVSSASPVPQKPAKGPQVPAAEATGGVPPVVWYMIAGGAVFVLFAIGIAVIVNALFSSSSDPGTSPSSSTASPNTVASSNSSGEPEASNVNSFRPEPSDGSAPAAGPAAAGSFDPSRQGQFDASSSPFDAAPSAGPAADIAPPQPAPVAEADPQPPASPAWQTDQLRIPFESQDEITFGPIGCPVVIVGRDVWHLEQKRIVGTLSGDVYQRGHKALAGNGQYFAAASKSPNQQDTSIRVWNTVTGETCCEIPGDPEKFYDLILFSRNQYLLVGGRLRNEIEVWDVAANQQMPTITVPSRRLEADQITFSADGQYYTSVVKDRLTVVDTKARRTAAVMESPPPLVDPQETLNDIQRQMRANRVIADIELVRFSPDGQELAAVISSRQPRLVCWNSRGRLIFDQWIQRVQHVFFFDPAFEWLPDGSGWIISGHIYDRKTQRIVFAIRMPFGDDPMFFPLDRNRLVGAFPHDPDVLQVVDIPWDRIEASLKLLEERAPAILSPYEPVSVEVELSGLRGSGSATESLLREALAKRLQEDGIRVEAGRPTSFRLRFSEKAGDTLPIYERQSPFDFRGRDTGRTATESIGQLVVELVADGQVLWRDTISARSSSRFRDEITDATIRKSMMDSVTREMDQVGIPYFIPRSPDSLALPIVFE